MKNFLAIALLLCAADLSAADNAGHTGVTENLAALSLASGPFDVEKEGGAGDQGSKDLAGGEGGAHLEVAAGLQGAAPVVPQNEGGTDGSAGVQEYGERAAEHHQEADIDSFHTPLTTAVLPPVQQLQAAGEQQGDAQGVHDDKQAAPDKDKEPGQDGGDEAEADGAGGGGTRTRGFHLFHHGREQKATTAPLAASKPEHDVPAHPASAPLASEGGGHDQKQAMSVAAGHSQSHHDQGGEEPEKAAAAALPPAPLHPAEPSKDGAAPEQNDLGGHGRQSSGSSLGPDRPIDKLSDGKGAVGGAQHGQAARDGQAGSQKGAAPVLSPAPQQADGGGRQGAPAHDAPLADSDHTPHVRRVLLFPVAAGAGYVGMECAKGYGWPGVFAVTGVSTLPALLAKLTGSKNAQHQANAATLGLLTGAAVSVAKSDRPPVADLMKGVRQAGMKFIHVPAALHALVPTSWTKK